MLALLALLACASPEEPPAPADAAAEPAPAESIVEEPREGGETTEEIAPATPAPVQTAPTEPVPSGARSSAGAASPSTDDAVADISDAKTTDPDPSIEDEDTLAPEEPEEPEPETRSPLQQLRDSLTDQLVRFNVPDGRVEETVSALLVIEPGADEAAAAALFEIYAARAHAPVTGERQTDHALVSPRTRAVLTSRSAASALTIEAVTPDLRLLDPESTTRWEWKLTPHEGGAHTLLLTLYAVAEGGGDLEVETWSREMQVEADEVRTIKTMAQDHWEWVWTFLLGPVVAWGWRRRQLRKDG